MALHLEKPSVPLRSDAVGIITVSNVRRFLLGVSFFTFVIDVLESDALVLNISFLSHL